MEKEENGKESVKKEKAHLFKPGQVANPNGRKPGTPNKITTQMRESMHDFFMNNKEKIQEDFEALEPKDRLNFISKLFPYFMPSLTATKSEVNVKHTGAEHLATEQLHEILLKISNGTTTTTTTTTIINELPI